MNKILGFSAVLALLAACDERPAAGVDDPVDPVDPDDPAPVFEGGSITVGALQGANFVDGELVVTILLDGTDVPQVYDPSGSVGVYDRYTQQESDINRAFTAIAGENLDGSLVGVVAMDGGQFNRFFGGGSIERDGYSAPAAGFYYYTGGYSGLLNFGGPGADTSGDVPDSVEASQVGTVTGQVYLLADFVDNNVEGVVYDRNADIFGETVALQDVVLINSNISGTGTFGGGAELDDLTGVGSYIGAFDEGATYVAGIVSLEAGLMTGAVVDGAAYEGNGFEQEYGLFVIGQCLGGADSCFTSE